MRKELIFDFVFGIIFLVFQVSFMVVLSRVKIEDENPYTIGLVLIINSAAWYYYFLAIYNKYKGEQ